MRSKQLAQLKVLQVSALMQRFQYYQNFYIAKLLILQFITY
ncbi:unnamed protein product [Paramecium octaurelia]|uniref:Uncharacterized protein n=1 Tax=Paramecium octaurelia TaxID=43137 RepID=A0A8S1TVX2_PAROT|nr:unnamed protein product [Paramecium octaurelia]